MTILFSVRDIAEAAVEKEKRRRAFYAKVCELSTDRRLKDLFQFLADEEDKHVAAFTQLRDSLPQETRAEEYDEEMDAYMDSIPMVILTGQVPTPVIGSDAFQEVDTVGITRPCVKHNFLIKRVEDIADTIKKAGSHPASTEGATRITGSAGSSNGGRVAGSAATHATPSTSPSTEGGWASSGRSVQPPSCPWSARVAAGRVMLRSPSATRSRPASSQGAPRSRNGALVPRPSETWVASSRAVPG